MLLPLVGGGGPRRVARGVEDRKRVLQLESAEGTWHAAPPSGRKRRCRSQIPFPPRPPLRTHGGLWPRPSQAPPPSPGAGRGAETRSAEPARRGLRRGAGGAGRRRRRPRPRPTLRRRQTPAHPGLGGHRRLGSISCGAKVDLGLLRSQLTGRMLALRPDLRQLLTPG